MLVITRIDYYVKSLRGDIHVIILHILVNNFFKHTIQQYLNLHKFNARKYEINEIRFQNYIPYKLLFLILLFVFKIDNSKSLK